jgi:hypothetical protein
MPSKLVTSSTFSVRPSSRSTLVSLRWSATVAAEEMAVAVVVAGAVAAAVVAVVVEVEAGAAETLPLLATAAGKALALLSTRLQ